MRPLFEHTITLIQKLSRHAEDINILELEIEDDGVGFDVESVQSNYEQRGSLGMINLRERAELIGGDLTLKSAPGYGTRITIYVPKELSERQRRRGTTGQLTLPPHMLAG